MGIGLRVLLSRGPLRKNSRNKDTASESFLNGGNEVSDQLRLHHVSDRSSGQACLDEIGIGVHRQENDLRRAARYAQLLAGINAIENRHGDICDDDIGLKAFRSVEQRLAVRHARDNFASGCQ
jgi:hypothetical protein